MSIPLKVGCETNKGSLAFLHLWRHSSSVHCSSHVLSVVHHHGIYTIPYPSQHHNVFRYTEKVGVKSTVWYTAATPQCIQVYQKHVVKPNTILCHRTASTFPVNSHGPSTMYSIIDQGITSWSCSHLQLKWRGRLGRELVFTNLYAVHVAHKLPYFG